MKTYTIGIDFGSLSGRAVLVDSKTGQEIASSVYEYPHAFMDEALPDGTPLGLDWALQHPQDYLDVLYHTIPDVLKQSDVDHNSIIGIGTDFTACTVLPVRADGTPLCFLKEYENRPHAYVKMWKHHAAQGEANELNKLAMNRKEIWLQNYGGKISSEWAIPKLMQIAKEDPEIYEQCEQFIEAADWIVWQLCGVETRNSCTAGYKEIYNEKIGYPSKEFFKELHPRMENVVEEKLGTDIMPLGTRAGSLTKKMAEKIGLHEGIAIAVGNVDAHVCVPAVGIDGPGKMLAIIGTSTCHIMMGNEEKQVPGMCGVVKDGVMPGYYGYEAGQSCVGDHFAWFMKNCLPNEYKDEAQRCHMDIHEFMSEKAKSLKPGESGLLALDWWNGNRSILVDVDLSGLLLGMTLQTKAEEIYLSLLEATAFGTRMIIENYRKYGVEVSEFYASGGISQKNKLMMQIYSDVLNMPIYIAESTQAPALGSAIFASVAAGSEKGGYDNVFKAAKAMGKIKDEMYHPIKENVLIYEQLFQDYSKLHDYFGRGKNDVMKRLKKIKTKQIEG